MSTTIDERVVEMRFDNDHFEKNVQTSMSTLDKLKQKLNLTGASKGLENLDKAAKKTDFSCISNAVEKVGVTMSKWEYASLQTFSNIVSKAESAATRLIKAWTIDPVKTGFQEYETQINAVQTILANTQSKGTTIDDVNTALDELNTYADKTIYNFTEMTRNIGTFTAAGIELEPAVKSIQGIANLAAVSGSNAQQASTAMYQLSQALSTGTLKLQDWNSVVNAGMGGQVFQDALKRTARAYGVEVDKIIEANGSFRESLQTGWITSDILTETLNQLAGVYSEADLIAKGYTKEQAKEITELAKTAEDAATKVKTFTQLFDTISESIQSGWTSSWELLIGDFNEAKELLTGVSDAVGGVIEKMNTKRNKKLEKALTSPWEKLIKEVNEAGISTTDFENAIKETAKKHGIKIDQMIKKEGSFSKTLQNGWLTKEMIIETMNKYTESIDGTADATGKAGQKLEDFEKIVKRVINGDFGNGDARVKKLTEAGYDYATIQDLVNKTLSGQKVEYDKLSDSQLQNMGYTSEQIKLIRELASEASAAGTPLSELIEDMSTPSGRDLLIDSVKNVVEYIAEGPLKSIKEGWKKIFPEEDDGSGLYSLIEKFHALTESLTFTKEQGENLSGVFAGLFAGFEITHSVLSWSILGGLKILNEVLRLFGMNLMDVLNIIADYIVKLRDLIKENTLLIGWQAKVGKMLYAVIVGIEDCVAAFLKLEVVQDTLKKLKQAFVDLFKAIGVNLNFDGTGIEMMIETIEQLFDNLEDYITKLDSSKLFNAGLNIVVGLANGITKSATYVINAIIDLASKLINAFTKILGIQSPSKVFFILGGFIVAGLLEGLIGGSDKLMDTVTSLANTLINTFDDVIQNGLPYIINLIKTIGSKFYETLQETEFDLGSMVVFGSLIATFILIKKAIDIMEGFSKPFANMGGMLESLGGMFKAFGDSFKKLTKATTIFLYAEALKSMALSVAILAGALVVLSMIETKPLLISLGVLAGIAGILIGLMSFTKKMEPEGFVRLSVLLVSLGASMLLMAVAVKTLASVDVTGADNAIGGLIVMFAGIGALIAVYGKFVKGKAATSMHKAGFMVMEMAVGMFIVATAIERLASIPDGDIQKGLKTMLAIELLFGTFVVVVGNHGKRAKDVSTLLSKLGFAIAILALTIKLIATMDWGDINKGLVIMAGASALFSAVIIASKVAGKNARKAGSMLMQMSTAIAVLALTIKLIATINTGDIVRGGIVIAGAMAMFALFIKASFYAGQNAAKAGVMILSMAASMLLLSFAIKIIAGISVGDVLKGLAVITTVGMLFMAMTAVTKIGGANAAKAGAMMVSMAGAMMLLAVAMALMSMLKIQDIVVATAAIGSIMGMFAIIVATTALAKDCTKTMLIMVGAIAVIAISIAAISSLTTSKVAAATACIMGVMGMFAVLIGVSQFAATAPLALVTIGILGAIMAALGFVLIKIAELPVDNLLSTAASLSIMILSLSASCVLLSGLAGIAPAALAGVLIFGVMIAELALVLAAIGKLYQIEGITTAINDGGAFLSIIGQALGRFISGIGQGITSGFPKMGEDLSLFMDKISGFITGASKITGESVSGVAKLAEMLLMLTGANFIDAITSKLTGGSSLTKFAEQLVPFGEGVTAYANSVKSIDDKKIEGMNNAAKAATAISDLANNLPNSGGLAGLFAGNNDIDDFGEKLEPFGNGMTAYSQSLSGLSITKVENGTKAATSIAKAIRKVSDINSDDTRGFKNALNTLGEAGVSGFVKAFETNPEHLNTIGANLAANVVSGVASKNTAIKTAGSNLLYEFKKGVTTRTTYSSVKASVKEMVKGLYDTIRTYYDEFKSAGKYLVEGFANGIDANTYLATARAREMAAAAERAAKAELDEHSPSKVGYEIGDYFGIAFVNGISDNVDSAYNTSAEMASSAKSGMSKAISKIGQLLGGEMDFNPTISPVLDLSNVRSGAGAISDILGFGSSIGVMSNINAISTTMNRRNQNGGNGEVVSAIDRLRKDLGNVGNTSYNINGITYDDGSNVASAVQQLVRAAIIGGRV